MNIYQYTAFQNPQGASRVIGSYGLQPSRDPRQLGYQLAYVVAKGGEPALVEVAKIHPDFALIQENVEPKAPLLELLEKKTEKTPANTCGCHSNANGFFNANGATMKSEVSGRLNPNLSEIIVTGGIALIGLALVLKLMK